MKIWSWHSLVSWPPHLPYSQAKSPLVQQADKKHSKSCPKIKCSIMQDRFLAKQKTPDTAAAIPSEILFVTY